LNYPLDAILDKKKNSLIICDHRNGRVVTWSLQNSDDRQVLIPRIVCYGLAMDNNEDLYVCNWGQNEVRRWKQGDTKGTIVAGGNGPGNQLNQLNQPNYIFVDEYRSVYVSDAINGRIMKWITNATEGIRVAPEQNPNLVVRPNGMIVDHVGNIYMSDSRYHHITRWSSSAIEGYTVVGKNHSGTLPDLLKFPSSLSFDRHGNLYVAD
jgi:sugar lactone lactonase YvrE